MRWFALVLLFVAAPVWAADWYILDFGIQKCVNARDFSARKREPQFRSPLALRDYLRSNPEAALLMNYKGTRIHTLEPGVYFVEVKFLNSAMNYFSSYGACHAVKKAAIADGNMPNLNELR